MGDTYQVEELCPETGRPVLLSISDCRGCGGSGREWHLGCGDEDQRCSSCLGEGVTVATTYKGG